MSFATFTQADLRGCDFSHADLRHADFSGARLGATGRRWLGAIAPVVATSALMVAALGPMIFGILGNPPEAPAAAYAPALYSSLAVSGLPPSFLAGQSPRWRRGLLALSGAASGALLGFFHGGSAADNSPTMAIAGAVLGGLLGGGWTSYFAGPLTQTVVLTASTLCAYGLTFLLWSQAIAHLTPQVDGGAVSWGLVAGALFWASVQSFGHLGTVVNGRASTCFWNADLRDAQLPDLAAADTTEARGIPRASASD